MTISPEYFEAGHRSARRHHLVWQVLDGSFRSERPLFGLLRRVVLVPEAAGRAAEVEVLDDLTPLMPRGDAQLRRQVLEASVEVIRSVRHDWPFLGRLEMARRQARTLNLRPSLLMLLAARCGDASLPGLTNFATALDVAYLAVLAQTGVEEEAEARDATAATGVTSSPSS